MEKENVIEQVHIVENERGVHSTHTKVTSRFVRFGKELRISPKSNATLNAPGFKAEYFVETVSVLIGIGNDHAAELIMSKEAWLALTSGAEASVTTTEQFKKQYL